MIKTFQLINDFVFVYPLFMSMVWMIGGLMFFWRHERKTMSIPELKEYPFFSILIPCHNEGQHIITTIEQALDVDYPNFEIIAINDGSTDNTGEIISGLVKKYDNVRCINFTMNQGKAAAMSIAAMAAKGECLLTIDADALVEKNILTWMAWHFEKFPRVGAITGNPRILNRTTLLAKIQTGEFSTIIGLIKRTQRILGKMLTISGVVGAFRREALHSIAYWDTDMVTEDIDITWKLQTKFWDIRYEPRAICWIMVPETLKGLWNQRFRWAQGGVEVLRKHRVVWKDWRQRRIWPIYIESVFSVLWAYAFWILVIAWVVGQVFNIALPIELSPPLPPEWTGAILAATCILQFSVSLYVDHVYEKKLFRYLFWVIWYPFMYWIISSIAVVAATPIALFKKKGTRATWKSPDRGLGTER